MRCDEFTALIDLYLDGEVDDADSAEIESHAAYCPRCAEVMERQAGFRGALHELASEHEMDASFRDRLDAAMACQASPVCTAPTASRFAPRLAAAAVLAVGLSGVLVALSSRAPMDAAPAVSSMASVSGFGAVGPEVVDESVRWHSRPLPVEVMGPDGAEVEDWFRGKLDFRVAPPDFSRRAHLLGARLGNVRDNEAAFLVYDVDGRKLSVMMFDANGAPLPTAHTPTGEEVPFFVQERNGLNVAVHQQDGVAYTFTSDLPDSELVDLVNAAFSY